MRPPRRAGSAGAEKRAWRGEHDALGDCASIGSPFVFFLSLRDFARLKYFDVLLITSRGRRDFSSLYLCRGQPQVDMA